MSRLFRKFSLALVLGLTMTTSSFAQEAAPAEGEGEGAGPLPGYVATGVLAAAAMFVLCKSARR